MNEPNAPSPPTHISNGACSYELIIAVFTSENATDVFEIQIVSFQRAIVRSFCLFGFSLSALINADVHSVYENHHAPPSVLGISRSRFRVRLRRPQIRREEYFRVKRKSRFFERIKCSKRCDTLCRPIFYTTLLYIYCTEFKKSSIISD